MITQQKENTIFKIVPEEWNNVANIVYDAVSVLINTADIDRAQSFRRDRDN